MAIFAGVLSLVAGAGLLGYQLTRGLLPASSILPTDTPLPAAAAPATIRPFDFIQMTTGEQDLLRQAEIELKTSLPDSPQQVMVYRQKLYELPLTAERAKEIADQMGMHADPTPRVGEGNDLMYLVNDGKYRLSIFAGEPAYFNYETGAEISTPSPQKAMIFDERSRLAVEFLKDHHLLNFPYQIEPGSVSVFSDWSIAVAQVIDGKVLYENDLREPRILVIFNEQQQVAGLFYRLVSPLPDHLAAIRPAKAVLRDLQTHRLAQASFRVYELKDSHGSKLGNSVPVIHTLMIDRVELAYYALDLSTHGSLNAAPIDYPGYQIIPVWRFTGDLPDGRRFEMIAEAVGPDISRENQ